MLCECCHPPVDRPVGMECYVEGIITLFQQRPTKHKQLAYINASIQGSFLRRTYKYNVYIRQPNGEYVSWYIRNSHHMQTNDITPKTQNHITERELNDIWENDHRSHFFLFFVQASWEVTNPNCFGQTFQQRSCIPSGTSRHNDGGLG